MDKILIIIILLLLSVISYATSISLHEYIELNDFEDQLEHEVMSMYVSKAIEQSFEIRSKCIIDNNNNENNDEEDNCNVELSNELLNKIIIDITNKRKKITKTKINTYASSRSSSVFDYYGIIQYLLIFLIMLIEINYIHTHIYNEKEEEISEGENELQYCVSNRAFRTFIQSHLPFSHFLKFLMLLLPSLLCYFGYIDHGLFIPNVLKFMIIWSLCRKSILIYNNTKNLRKYLPSFSSLEEWKKISVLWLLNRIFLPDGLVSIAFMLGSVVLSFPLYYNFYHYYEYQDNIKAYLARETVLRTIILLIINVLKLLAIGSPISFRRYVLEDLYSPIATLSLFVFIPLFLLIQLYFIFFGYKYTYMGKLLSLFFLISIVVQVLLSSSIISIPLHKREAFTKLKTNFINSFMLYFQSRLNNKDKKDTMRFAYSLYYALIDKTIRNYIFAMGPNIEDTSIGVKESLILYFRYTLFESLMNLPDVQKIFEDWETSKKEHDERMNQIFNEGKERLKKAKERNNKNDNDNDDKANKEYEYTSKNANDTNTINEKSNNNDTDNMGIDDDLILILIKKLWSDLLGVKIEDYNILYKG